LKSEGVERSTYVRLGSTNRRADAALTGELWRRVEIESYDEQPMLATDSEAIDFAALSECFAAHRMQSHTLTIRPRTST
jgi:predicted HTH transcriptional regulator